MMAIITSQGPLKCNEACFVEYFGLKTAINQDLLITTRLDWSSKWWWEWTGRYHLSEQEVGLFLFVWVLWHINICRLFNAKSILIQINSSISMPMAWETRVQSQDKSYQRLKKWYLMSSCLILSIIRYRSRVKWSNSGKGVAPSLTPSSYWKGSFGSPSTMVANFTLFQIIQFSINRQFNFYFKLFSLVTQFYFKQFSLV